MTSFDEGGREPHPSQRTTGGAGGAARRFALPAVALVLALTALLALWQARTERTDDAGALPAKAATATAAAANASQATRDGVGGSAAGVGRPTSEDGTADASPTGGTIGEAFSYGIATQTPLPLLARTALLPLAIAADEGAIARAIAAAERDAEARADGDGSASGEATATQGDASPRDGGTGLANGNGSTGANAPPTDAPDAADPARAAALAALPPDTPAWQRTLLAERVGYGRGATGGLGGRIVRVTTLDDEGEGSIRAAMETPGPRWVIFDVSGAIRLDGMLRVPSDTTIDGRGTYVAFQGSGLDIRDVENVIVSHVVLEGGQGDAVSVRARARRVWLHHLSLRDFSDGLIDVTREATDVTVSWCRFEEHEKVMLIGGDGEMPDDAVIRVTLHHNLFDRTGQRQPRLRFGRVHAFNNAVDRWRSIGMAANHGGELLVEHNVFVAGERAEEAVRAGADEDAPGRVRAVGNLLLEPDGAGGWRSATAEEIALRFETRHPERVFDAAEAYPYVATPADTMLLERLREEAGWRPLPPLPVAAQNADDR